MAQTNNTAKLIGQCPTPYDKMGYGDMIFSVLMVLVLCSVFCSLLIIIGALNNEKVEVIIDCYDKEGNIINELTCTEERYYCNKLENLILSNCLEEEVE